MDFIKNYLKEKLPINQYYENTKNAPPHQMTKKIIEKNIKPENAIDLGCGAGRDTIYLIKNGWNVLSIDKEDTRDIISSKLNEDELKRFKFKIGNFENIDLGRSKLIVANFSISFCNRKYFNELWDKIVDSISNDRIFCWEFFRYE